ncbi:MAG: hypothetical protein JO168_03110 [Solirubrobacterales bacterium]|nr:hypothetical protein [Solirubrobacterales bacterium]MBV9714656.1 hypothetical protein [Solirubrobacterales bacterium]
MSSLAGGSAAPMSTDERLLYEARWRPRYAVVAALAGICLMAAAIIQLSGPHTKVDELTLDLITANQRFGLDVTAAVINALGSLALAATLFFLLGAVRARNPQSQPFIGVVVGLGGVLAAIAGVAYAVIIGIKAHQFVTTGAQTYQEANHLTSSGGIVALQLVGQGAALLLALGFVLVSLGAMRVGLLTRFMGYLGMLAGVLILFQITQVPVVQGYWLLALAYLFTGRWPTGVPPAWRSGQTEKWPSSQELRERRIRAAGAKAGGDGRSRRAPAPEPVTTPAPSSATPASGAGRGAQKRKRKRRK